MRLEAKKYTYRQIKDFEKETQTKKDLTFLLENVSCLRILGWTLVLPLDLKFNTGGFGDVIKFTETTRILLNKEAKKWNRK